MTSAMDRPAVPTRIVVFHIPRPEVRRKDLLAHWRTTYAERVAALRPAIGFDSYVQFAVDRPLASVRAILSATRSRPMLRAIAALGRRSRLLTAGAPAEPELGGCLVVDQFHFSAGNGPNDAALAPLREEWGRWCERSLGLIGEDRVAVASPVGGPQVKIMLVIRRRSDASRAEMQEYWRHQHVPLARSKQGALRFTSYDQVEALPDPSAQAALRAWTGEQIASHDGIASISYRNRLHLVLAFLSPGAQGANVGLILDELHFVDGPSCEFLVGIEQPIVAMDASRATSAPGGAGPARDPDLISQQKVPS